MRWEQKLQHATLSDVGLRRQNNEDSAASLLCASEDEFDRRGHLFLVADGMGGHAVGELASQMAAEAIPHAWSKLPGDSIPQVLRQALVTANKLIHERGSQNRDFLRMGTTCTTLALTPGGAYVAHVGDSRCYRIRRDRIDQLTFDHSLHWEMQRQARETGVPVELPEHRNIITRSLGPESEVQVDVEGPFLVLPGDIFLLCSDGLSGEVRDDEIGGLAAELAPSQACKALVHLANMRGGGDNCTMTIVRVGELPANVSPPEIPIEVAPSTPLSPPTLVLGGIGVLLLSLGLIIVLMGQILAGAIMATLSLAGLIALKLFGPKPPQPELQPETDLSRTNLWRPYRTAVNKSTQELYESLSNLEGQVAKVARDEGWPVNWSQHSTAVQAAVESRLEQRFGKGLRDISRAIDLLMTALYTARRSPRPAAVPE
ncbi:MAG TPA: protein phosphatase 2C domain-containing protein, partial [Caulifigura sp.]|nr:protein phosphatase 2C domain-containing protein [Caulifigura sp.]